MKKIFSQFEIPKPGAPGGEQMRWMALMALIGLGVANVFYFRSTMTTKEITMKEFFDLYLTKGLVCTCTDPESFVRGGPTLRGDKFQHKSGFPD